MQCHVIVLDATGTTYIFYEGEKKLPGIKYLARQQLLSTTPPRDQRSLLLYLDISQQTTFLICITYRRHHGSCCRVGVV